MSNFLQLIHDFVIKAPKKRSEWVCANPNRKMKDIVFSIPGGSIIDLSLKTETPECLRFLIIAPKANPVTMQFGKRNHA